MENCSMCSVLDVIVMNKAGVPVFMKNHSYDWRVAGILVAIRTFAEQTVGEGVRLFQTDNKVFVYELIEDFVFVVVSNVPYDMSDYGNVLTNLRKFLRCFGNLFLEKNCSNLQHWRQISRIDMFEFEQEFHELVTEFNKRLEQEVGIAKFSFEERLNLKEIKTIIP